MDVVFGTFGNIKSPDIKGSIGVMSDFIQSFTIGGSGVINDSLKEVIDSKIVNEAETYLEIEKYKK